MYIIRRDKGKTRSFLTYDGWLNVGTEALDLSNAIRFTSGEAKQSNLGKHESFVYYGCYDGMQ